MPPAAGSREHLAQFLHVPRGVDSRSSVRFTRALRSHRCLLECRSVDLVLRNLHRAYQSLADLRLEAELSMRNLDQLTRLRTLLLILPLMTEFAELLITSASRMALHVTLLSSSAIVNPMACILERFHSGSHPVSIFDQPVTHSGAPSNEVIGTVHQSPSNSDTGRGSQTPHPSYF